MSEFASKCTRDSLLRTDRAPSMSPSSHPCSAQQSGTRWCHVWPPMYPQLLAFISSGDSVSDTTILFDRGHHRRSFLHYTPSRYPPYHTSARSIRQEGHHAISFGVRLLLQIHDGIPPSSIDLNLQKKTRINHPVSPQENPRRNKKNEHTKKRKRETRQKRKKATENEAWKTPRSTYGTRKKTQGRKDRARAS